LSEDFEKLLYEEILVFPIQQLFVFSTQKANKKSRLIGQLTKHKVFPGKETPQHYNYIIKPYVL
jgi:hypothetical protein